MQTPDISAMMLPLCEDTPERFENGQSPQTPSQKKGREKEGRGKKQLRKNAKTHHNLFLDPAEFIHVVNRSGVGVDLALHRTLAVLELGDLGGVLDRALDRRDRVELGNLLVQLDRHRLQLAQLLVLARAGRCIGV